MKKYGQSIIEYVLIAVLVILGIVIMGAYVLRATNAHFKMWDDGVQDSFQENIIQAPQFAVPYISTNCICNSSSTGSCGSGAAGSQCAGDEMIWAHSCLPQLCDGEATSYCQYNEDCCKVYQKGSCGTTPLLNPPSPPSGTPVIPTGNNGLPMNYQPSPTHPNVNQLVDCTTYPIAGGGYTGCYYNQRTYATECSDLPVACCPDTSCAPQCTGIVLDGGSGGNSAGPSILPCPDQPPASGNNNLSQDYSVTYVATDTLEHCSGVPNCTYCDGVTPCQVYCNQNAGFFPNYVPGPNGTKTINGCINNFQVAPNSCTSTQSSDCGTTVADAPCCSNSTGPAVKTINNLSFSICTSIKNLAIETAYASPTSSSTCVTTSCCNDNGAGFCCTSDTGSCTASTTAGAITTCWCQVNLTVSSTL